MKNILYPSVLALSMSLSGNTQAAMLIHLDFGAAWETGINAATTNAGVSNFNVTERAQIEANIQSQLETMYGNFDVSFSSVAPVSGAYTTLDFGATTASSTTLGQAGVDFRNLTTTQTADVYTLNFGGFIESFDPRSTQILEVSTSLAGTAAHELGHSFGMLHNAAFGDPGITPANYANTSGIQNTHIMATGSTGLNEVERETLRTFSQWSNLILETGNNLTADPLNNSKQLEVADASATSGSAQSVSLVRKSISDLDAALIEGSLFDDSDVDTYALSFDSAGKVSAQIYSQWRFSDSFDTVLTLLDSDGTTILSTADDILVGNDTYNSGTKLYDDSFLLNIDIASAGTYYLQVSSAGNLSLGAGGAYDVLVGFDGDNLSVAIPSVLSLSLIGLLGMHRRRYS